MATSTGRPAIARAASPSRRRATKPTPPVRYLIDNSVWARLSTEPDVVAALKSVVDLTEPDNLLICPPTAAEAGFGARTPADHDALREQLTAFPQCGAHPSADDALDIQSRLWNGGLLRAAGPMDTLIAAYAIRNDATLLHYDRDFEHIASVEPTFKHQWIVPRGSIK